MEDVMEEQERPAEKLIATAGQMIETYRDLMTLTVVENITRGVSVSVVGIISLATSCFVVLFGALGLAWWIGEEMNNMKAGFFIAGSVFLLLLIVVLLIARKTLLPWIQDMVIKSIYEKDQ
ncbi:MAG TPA: hypothetical protein VK508_21975 [Cyclobacteriaceae bacterium]|nr:hypothetical protein [Cyclobacteriaceae bacterium]